MPKILTADGYTIKGWSVGVDEAGQVNSFAVQTNIGYSDGESSTRRERQSYDLWAVAPQAQKDRVQALQDLIKTYLDGQILS